MVVEGVGEVELAEICVWLQRLLASQLSGCPAAFCSPLLICCGVRSRGTALKLGGKGRKLTGDLRGVFGQRLVCESPRAARGKLCKPGGQREWRVRVASVPGGPSPPGLPSQAAYPSAEALAKSPSARLRPVGKTSLFHPGRVVSLLFRRKPGKNTIPLEPLCRRLVSLGLAGVILAERSCRLFLLRTCKAAIVPLLNPLAESFL